MFLFALCGSFVAEVQAIASMIEKQAQIVVKQKMSAESKKGKEAVLAQYGNVTDEEEYPWCCHFRKNSISNKNCFPWKWVEIVLNTSTEAVEEEYVGGNAFPGNEKCILSQDLTLEIITDCSVFAVWLIWLTLSSFSSFQW